LRRNAPESLIDSGCYVITEAAIDKADEALSDLERVKETVDAATA